MRFGGLSCILCRRRRLSHGEHNRKPRIRRHARRGYLPRKPTSRCGAPLFCYRARTRPAFDIGHGPPARQRRQSWLRDVPRGDCERRDGSVGVSSVGSLFNVGYLWFVRASVTKSVLDDGDPSIQYDAPTGGNWTIENTYTQAIGPEGISSTTFHDSYWTGATATVNFKGQLISFRLNSDG